MDRTNSPIEVAHNKPNQCAIAVACAWFPDGVKLSYTQLHANMLPGTPFRTAGQKMCDSRMDAPASHVFVLHPSLSLGIKDLMHD